MNLFFFFFRSAWLRDLTHFVYARVKEKELERSDGVLLFLPREECITQFSFFFRFSFVLFLFDERIFVFVREVSNFCVTERRKKAERWDQRKKGVEHGTKRTNFISLKEQILYRIIFTTDN